MRSFHKLHSPNNGSETHSGGMVSSPLSSPRGNNTSKTAHKAKGPHVKKKVGPGGVMGFDIVSPTSSNKVHFSKGDSSAHTTPRDRAATRILLGGGGGSGISSPNVVMPHADSKMPTQAPSTRPRPRCMPPALLSHGGGGGGHNNNSTSDVDTGPIVSIIDTTMCDGAANQQHQPMASSRIPKSEGDLFSPLTPTRGGTIHDPRMHVGESLLQSMRTVGGFYDGDDDASPEEAYIRSNTAPTFVTANDSLSAFRRGGGDGPLEADEGNANGRSSAMMQSGPTNFILAAHMKGRHYVPPTTSAAASSSTPSAAAARKAAIARGQMADSILLGGETAHITRDGMCDTNLGSNASFASSVPYNSSITTQQPETDNAAHAGGGKSVRARSNSGLRANRHGGAHCSASSIFAANAAAGSGQTNPTTLNSAADFHAEPLMSDEDIIETVEIIET